MSMTHIFKKTLFISSSLLCTSAFPCKADLSHAEKIYINQEDLCLDNQNIFLRVNNNWIAVDNLHTDQKGFYALVNEEDLISFNYFYHDTDTPPVYQVCSNCQFSNELRSTCCAKCGQSLGETAHSPPNNKEKAPSQKGSNNSKPSKRK